MWDENSIKAKKSRITAISRSRDISGEESVLTRAGWEDAMVTQHSLASSVGILVSFRPDMILMYFHDNNENISPAHTELEPTQP
jgi:hypothetical protein